MTDKKGSKTNKKTARKKSTKTKQIEKAAEDLHKHIEVAKVKDRHVGGVNIKEIDMAVMKELDQVCKKDAEGKSVVVQADNLEKSHGVFRRSDSEFANSIMPPVATHKGVTSDVEKLKRELERQKAFANKAIAHFKTTISEKNKVIENLKEEGALARRRADMLDEKLKKAESIMDKLLLDNFMNEEISNEDKFDKFIEDLKTIFN